MTADAKVGLLLALIFIVAIAFVINGLPLFNESESKTGPQKNYVDKYEYTDPGLVGNVRKVAPALNRTISLKQITPTSLEKQPETTRYEEILPKANEVIEKSSPSPEPLQKTVIPIPLPLKSDIKPEEYTVKQGDNLADIAKKFYGDELGNKLVNIERIFKANSKVLKSSDELHIGQKLIIPALGPDDTTGTKTLSQNIADPVKSAEFRLYTVKEDDSLWAIAGEFLGDGARYKEIIKLNSSIIKDEDNLAVGVRLRLPKR